MTIPIPFSIADIQPYCLTVYLCFRFPFDNYMLMYIFCKKKTGLLYKPVKMLTVYLIHLIDKILYLLQIFLIFSCFPLLHLLAIGGRRHLFHLLE